MRNYPFLDNIVFITLSITTAVFIDAYLSGDESAIDYSIIVPAAFVATINLSYYLSFLTLKKGNLVWTALGYVIPTLVLFILYILAYSQLNDRAARSFLIILIANLLFGISKTLAVHAFLKRNPPKQ